MSLQSVDPLRAKRLIDEGALLVDIREPHEHARERIPGAGNRPLANLSDLQATDGRLVIFHCRTGARTSAYARQLAIAANCPAYLLEGGIDAWKKAGLPIELDRRQPIEIMRQVQITAGCLVLLGIVLGTWLNPAFYGLSAFIGAGLTFAGISGWCGMARLLALMPWNRRNLKPAGAAS